MGLFKGSHKGKLIRGKEGNREGRVRAHCSLPPPERNARMHDGHPCRILIAHPSALVRHHVASHQADPVGIRTLRCDPPAFYMLDATKRLKSRNSVLGSPTKPTKPPSTMPITGGQDLQLPTRGSRCESIA